MSKLLKAVMTAALLAACGAPTPPQSPELQYPAKHESAAAVGLYARQDAGTAVYDSELSYALGEPYPSAVTLTPSGEVYVSGCALSPGKATWSALSAVQGPAATLSLDGGTLSATLLEEGVVTAVLEGQITEVRCNGTTGVVTSLPLRHTLTLRVRRISGFVLEQLHQSWPRCAEKVVLPTDTTLWAPTVHPLDGAGQKFAAANASVPVGMTLRASGGLAKAEESWGLVASPGHVDVSVDTTLPVSGLSAFEVIGPGQLSSARGSFSLRKAAAKGFVSEPIVSGSTHELFFPEQENVVDLSFEDAVSAPGFLCSPMPASWFKVESSTPGKCAPAAVDAIGGSLPVVKIFSAGQCRVEVTIPDTDHRWSTSLTTRVP